MIIAGGDIDEAEDIKQAFSLLNMNSNNETIKFFKILDVIFIYDQLLSKTIIVKSIAKNVSNELEEDIGQFFQTEFSFKTNINILLVFSIKTCSRY